MPAFISLRRSFLHIHSFLCTYSFLCTHSFLRTHRALLARLLLGCALPLCSPPVVAMPFTQIGSPGADGAASSAGGSGDIAVLQAISGDINNTATAIGGKGGNGGAGPVTGGAGGDGGAAATLLLTGNKNYDPAIENTDTTTASALGGAGGAGGAGSIAGDGGNGGIAGSFATDTGENPAGALDAIVSDTMTVTATGGAGGAGANGGAGGSATAAGYLAPTNASGQMAATVHARGGNGGNGSLNGGRGGNAAANVRADLHGFPADDSATATASGGRGGNALNGANGDGGDAAARANGSIATRDLGLEVTARAVGGNSGSGGDAQTGNGGNARAVALGTGTSVADSNPTAIAIGGNGVARGGSAVATTDNTSALFFGDGDATASGGAGRTPGAALATARSFTPYLNNETTATANGAGLVRQVKIHARTMSLDGNTDSTTFIQSAVGDTTALQSQAPGVPTNTSLTVRAAGAPPGSVASHNIGNGAVWGVGEFGTSGQRFDTIAATTSYTLDTHTVGTPQHLWLDLLDATAGGSGNFRFSLIGGNGTSLFDRQFTGSDYVNTFDDRLLDLGSWGGLVDSSGLLTLKFLFSGNVPDIAFAFGQGATGGSDTTVPEPPAIALLLTGILGALLAKRSAHSGIFPRMRETRDQI